MFIYRTTEMPTLQKLIELERLVAVDGAGVNQPVGSGRVRACCVGETLQGPFSPKVLTSPGEILDLYVGDPTRFTLLSQSGFDPESAVQDGSGVAFDGNLWAELKGKTFTGLVLQRVDCDMVAANPSTTKCFVKFDVTVAAADQSSGVLNKDIIIPSGTRFADQAIGTATKIVATSQKVVLPKGTAVAANTITCGANFVQDEETGVLTYEATNPTTGVTAFFVKGYSATTGGSDRIDTAVDTATSGDATTVISGTISTIVMAGTGTDAYAPAAGGTQSTSLSNNILLNYAAAISKTLPGLDATNDIVAIWSARNYQTHGLSTEGAITMRTNLWANARAASRTGRGRVACVTLAPATGSTPTIAGTTKTAYQGLKTTDSVAASNADADRYWVSGPYQKVWSDELNANILVSAAGFRACMKVNLANAGKSEFQTSVGQPENDVLQAIQSSEDCFVANPLDEDDYVEMKAHGVAWLTKDRTAGWWFYSGVTGADPVLFQNRVPDNRRSFADEVQDLILGLAAKYAKKPGTPQRADAFVMDMTAYLETLKNPPIGDSRCKEYRILEGAAAGNTDKLNSYGVFLFQAEVQMYGDMNTIVINSQIGPNVVIAQVTGG